MQITVRQTDLIDVDKQSPFNDAICKVFKRIYPNSDIIVFSRSITIDRTVYFIHQKYPQLSEFILNQHKGRPIGLPITIEWDESTIPRMTPDGVYLSVEEDKNGTLR